mgnify:CR=1 FL=1|tara:strand:- start:700134 stop:700652 length:519 start_codon:yes stop_codon:yes gene_type:complete
MIQRNRNILLLVGFLISILVAYHYAFSKTFEIKKKIEKLEQEFINPELLRNSMIDLKKRNKFVDSVLKKNKFNNKSTQTNLLDFLNKESQKKNVKIVEFLEPHNISFENGQKKSYIFTLEGNYAAIEGIIFALEQKYIFGEIMSISFQRRRNFRTQTNFLHCRIILTSFSSK